MTTSRLALAVLSLALFAAPAHARAIKVVAAAADKPPACAAQPLFDRAGLADWPRNARLVVRDGQAVGLRFYALDPALPLAKVGLKEGDVLLRIAGVELTSPEQALEAYSRLRRATCSTLTVEREGNPMEIAFRLR
jgi:type II secretory pathway component PulC